MSATPPAPAYLVSDTSSSCLSCQRHLQLLPILSATPPAPAYLVSDTSSSCLSCQRHLQLLPILSATPPAPAYLVSDTSSSCLSLLAHPPWFHCVRNQSFYTPTFSHPDSTGFKSVSNITVRSSSICLSTPVSHLIRMSGI